MKKKKDMSKVEVARRERFWTQRQLAKESGVAPATAFLAEAGRPIRKANAVAICHNLRLDLESSGISICAWDK